MNTRMIGDHYEELVAERLEHEGYRILERNYRCKLGEVDIIARQDGYLVFLEVKYRSSGHYGSPQESVDARKRKRISNAASWYLRDKGYGLYTPVRFDVVAVSQQTIEVVRNAFPYCGKFG